MSSAFGPRKLRSLDLRGLRDRLGLERLEDLLGRVGFERLEDLLGRLGLKRLEDLRDRCLCGIFLTLRKK